MLRLSAEWQMHRAHLMSKFKAPSPIRGAEYDAIEAALLESARGRWFLSEYSSRNRSADTRMLLDAISRLESTMLNPSGIPKPENAHLSHELIEMAEAIAQTRKEIASMRPADQDDSKFTNATEELDAIVEATETATSAILEAAEDVQETAWQLREKGVDGEACDRLDARATDIYTACSFQDLTGQRTGKVVQVLAYLEKRVCSMIDIWGLDDIEIRHRNHDDDRPDAHLLNGPAMRGEGIDQDDVDDMLLAASIESLVVQNQAGTDALMNDPVMKDKPAMAAETPESSQHVAEPAVQQQSAASEPPAKPAAKGEIEADEFSPPVSLTLEELDEIKKQALFS